MDPSKGLFNDEAVFLIQKQNMEQEENPMEEDFPQQKIEQEEKEKPEQSLKQDPKKASKKDENLEPSLRKKMKI